MPVRNTIHIGDVKLTLVEELVMPTSARWMLPDHEAPFDVLEAARPWLEPHMLNERGHIASDRGLLVATKAGSEFVSDVVG